MEAEIITIDPRKLKLLELNARYMPHHTYARLVENVRRDRRLTSVPFCAAADVYDADDAVRFDEDGTAIYEVLSGNHRVMAAIDAGLTEIFVMVTQEPLSREQRTAIQLSHNAIDGEDDPAILKQLYDSLGIDWRQYSGLDDKTLALLEKVTTESLSEANLEFRQLSFVFLPEELDQVRSFFDGIKQLMHGDEVWLARWRDYDRLLDTLDDAGAAYNVKNTATILMLLLDIVERHITDLADGYDDGSDKPRHKGLVPIASVMGSTKLAAATATRLKRYVERRMAAGAVVGKYRLAPHRVCRPG